MRFLRWLGGIVIFFWLLGLFFRVLGWFLHILLIVAVCAFLLDFLFRRRY